MCERTGVTESILDSIKEEYLGLRSEYTPFDGDIILIINSQLSILKQLGVGPERTFSISGPEETWSQFFGDKDYLASVKELLGIKVKLSWDPPQNSALVQALKSRADELEWRLNVFEDTEGWNPSIN